MRRLTRKNSLTIITTIHQPNNELLHSFDKIYVLAKGGICLYSGVPNNLRQHFNECSIQCNENQVPIEILLKIASNYDKNQILSQKTVECNQEFIKEYLNENMISIFGKRISKRFKIIDFYYLLLRTMLYTYKCQWISLLFQIIIFQLIALIMKSHFNSDMTEPDGCIELGFGGGCNQTLKEIRDENLIQSNLKYHYAVLNAMAFVVCVIMSVTFCNEFKIFKNERTNGIVLKVIFLCVLIH